jgi:hypothetical protein
VLTLILLSVDRSRHLPSVLQPSRKDTWAQNCSADIMYVKPICIRVFRCLRQLLTLLPFISGFHAYHDLVRGGQYVWIVEQMHREYGPVVRRLMGKTLPMSQTCADPFTHHS